MEDPSRLQVAATYRLFATSCIHRSGNVTSTRSEDTQNSSAQDFEFVQTNRKESMLQSTDEGLTLSAWKLGNLLKIPNYLYSRIQHLELMQQLSQMPKGQLLICHWL